jgi:hypothetical protein
MYWWLSFADPHRPEGTQFLGVAIVEADSFLSAHSQCNRLGINPGGEIRGFELGAVPDKRDMNRLLTRDEAECTVPAAAMGH